MTNNELKELTKNRIFTVYFLKKDGTTRLMNCRTGVHKHLNPTSSGRTDNQKKGIQAANLLNVFDLEKSQYRMIPASRIIWLRFQNQLIKGPLFNQPKNV